MQRPLQIAFKRIDTSPALEALIRQRVDHLETLYPRLTGCRVVVEIPHRASETAKVPISVSVVVDGCENPDKSGGGCRVAAEASEPAGLLAGGAVCRSINCRCISSII